MNANESNGFARRVDVGAARERMFHAVATLDGLRAWWTPIVVGSPIAGGELHFGFPGMDEAIVMRVDAARPDSVRWTCLAHSGCEPWRGSTVAFELAARGAHRCELAFTHAGVPSDLVEPGWDRFLASLVSLVERGEGAPFAS
jgi:hypothetical protein